MQKLLIFREKVKAFIEKHDMLLRIILKIVAAFIMLYVMERLFVSVHILSRWSVKASIVLVCTFIPMTYAFPVFGLIYFVYLMTISRDAAVLSIIVMLLFYIIYKRNFSKYGYMTILSVALMQTPLSVMVPILIGMIAGPMGITPMLMGIFLYYYGTAVNTVMEEAARNVGTYQVYQLVVDAMISNKEILLCLVCFLVTLLIMWRLYHARISYAWQVSIPIAGIAYAVIYLYGGFLLGCNVSVVNVITSFALSVVILEVIQFFRGILDYSRAEDLEYEDDEYHYYVKVVPKITVSEEEINIKKINVQRKSLIRRREKKE
jgi:hypothetical protein